MKRERLLVLTGTSGLVVWLVTVGVLQAQVVKLQYSTRQNTREWFESARFGIFIHWDPRSNIEPGTFNPDIRPEVKRAQFDAVFKKIGPHTYKWQTWNPTKFDPNEWVKLFKEAGAQYFTFTTVHSVGFCNFDSPATDFDIMSTRYQKDIVEQLAKAAAGKIPVMWYFSASGGQNGEHIPKSLWPDYYKSLWKVKTYDQLRARNILHLVTNVQRYGKVAGIWWDGGGKWDMNEPLNKDLFKRLYKAQPWLIMSPRCGHPAHRTDWRCTEQRMGTFKLRPQWEMCIPMESSLWFWAGGKESNIKDTAHCLKLLIMCAVRDGNLLLDIGPMPDGRIFPLEAEILRRMGGWLRQYGESIYGTRGGPYEPGPWGGATRRGRVVYLHVLQELLDGKLALPPLPVRVKSAEMLTGGQVELQQTEDGLHLTLNRQAREAPYDRVVKLTLEEDAWKLKPIPTQRSKSLTKDAKVQASSEWSYKRPSGKRVVEAARSVLPGADVRSGWSADPSDKHPWLSVDLGRARTFRQLFLVEKHTRIRRFEVQSSLDGQHWDTVYQGARMNYCSVRLPKPVTARFVRVVFTQTTGGPPQMRRFELYK